MKSCAPCLARHRSGRRVLASGKCRRVSAEILRHEEEVWQHARELLGADLRPAGFDVPERYAEVHLSGMPVTTAPEFTAEPDERQIGLVDADLQVWVPRWLWVAVASTWPSAPMARKGAIPLHAPDVATLGPAVCETLQRDLTRWWSAALAFLDPRPDHRAALCAAFDLGGRDAARELVFRWARAGAATRRLRVEVP